MTKTTNEPNEIICECGHAANQHGDGLKINCWHQVNGRMDCKCQKTRVQVYASRLSTLEAAVEERNEMIKELRDSLSDNNAALILATGELQQRGFHVGLVVVKMIQSARALLAETAPKVQSEEANNGNAK